MLSWDQSRLAKVDNRGDLHAASERELGADRRATRANKSDEWARFGGVDEMVGGLARQAHVWHLVKLRRKEPLVSLN